MKQLKLLIALLMIASIFSCWPGVYDSVDRPEIFVKSVHVYDVAGPHFLIQKDSPDKIIIDSGDVCKSFNVNNWNEENLPGTYVYKYRLPKIEPINIAINHPTDRVVWKAEYIGKFRMQKRTFDTGQGIIPNGSISKTFEVFTGDFYFSVKGQRIFKQHLVNYAGSLEFKVYPHIGLVVISYTNLKLYPMESVYLIKIDPFEQAGQATINTPQHQGTGILGGDVNRTHWISPNP